MADHSDNPHVEHLPTDEQEYCKFCGLPMPSVGWDEADWHECTRKRDDYTFYCCDPCYWENVYDGPLQGDPSEPTAAEEAAYRRDQDRKIR